MPRMASEAYFTQHALGCTALHPVMGSRWRLNSLCPVLQIAKLRKESDRDDLLTPDAGLSAHAAARAGFSKPWERSGRLSAQAQDGCH